MATKIQKLFKQKGAYETSDAITNEAGAPAFERSLEEQTIQTLMVGNLEGTFYSDQKELTAKALDILTKMATKDPEFLAKAIIYARVKGYQRLISIVGLLVLSKANPGLFKIIFSQVIRQPGDLQDFVTLVRSKSVRSTGKSVRQAVGAWMNSISDYHVVKYGAPQKKPGAGSPTNLRDILRLAHPKPLGDMKYVFKYIIKRITGDKIPPTLLRKLPARIRAYETFKALTKDEKSAKKNLKKALALVEKHDLPYEVVLARVSSPAVWATLAGRAPFMNMLRNLNNYEKNGVFKNEQVTNGIIKRLNDPEQIKKSKQFPFRFYSAYRVFTGEPDVRDALVTAVDISVSNLPELGRTLVAVDESGSMDNPISERGTVTMRDIGNLFAAAMWKKSDRGILVPFTTVAYPVGISDREANEALNMHRRQHGHGADQYVTNSVRALKTINRKDSIVTIADNLKRIGGGTDLSAPLDFAMGRDFDTGIFITDSESWHDHLYRGHGVLDSIRKFRAKNPRSQFFFIQLAPNSALQVPQTEPGVHYIYGWSDNVLRYISQIVSGGKNQVEDVKKFKLTRDSGTAEETQELE